MGTLTLIKTPEQHKRTKHIDVQYHYIREIVAEGLASIKYVPTTGMIADLFTTPLPAKTFERLREQIGLQEVDIEWSTKGNAFRHMANGIAMEKEVIQLTHKVGKNFKRVTQLTPE